MAHCNTIFPEIMRRPWPPQFKNGFGDLFARGKSRKVSVLGAKSSYQPHDSMNLPEKTNFSQIFGIPPPFEQILPEYATYDELQSSTDR